MTGEADEWATITSWRVLTPGADYDPAAECEITRMELGSDEPVVCLSCTSRASTFVLPPASVRCPLCARCHGAR